MSKNIFFLFNNSISSGCIRILNLTKRGQNSHTNRSPKLCNHVMWRNEWMCRASLSWHQGTRLHTNTLALWPQWSAPRQSAGIVAGCRWIARPKSPWLITEAKYCSAETEDWEQAHKEPAGIQRSRSVVSWWPVESLPELQTKVREDIKITQKAPSRAFSWFKAPTSAFTFKTLC